MAETRLSDMIVPEFFNKYVETLTTEKSRLWQSGIIVDLSAEINAQLEGLTVNMPFFNDLDASDSNAEQILNDTADLTVSGITTGMDIAVKLMRGKAFGSTDLAGDLAGADPMNAIANRFANYWARRYQRSLLSTLAGATSAASMSANVLDISGLTGQAAEFDADSFIDANFLLGDEAGGLQAMAVHSRTMKTMVKQDMIDWVQDSKTGLRVPTYMGKEVIEDDGMPYNSGTGVFTTYLFGAGAIGYGSRAPKVPVEVERKALVGMGQEYIVNRKQWVLHPRGIKWVGTPSGGNVTPSNADLATATNWVRVYDPKVIRIVAFKHKNPA